MIFAHRLRRPSAPWLRVLAAVCAGMVVLLSAASVSPALHAWLHGETAESSPHHDCTHSHAHDHSGAHDDSGEPDSGSHKCAITLFSHGVTLANIFLATLDRLAAAPDAAPATHARAALPEPRHLRPQPQAPPVG